MKTVYMGTPDFAVPPLKALVEAGYEVAAVVTQPDKPKGRGKTLMATPVKEEALMHEIPVYQPQKIRNNQEFLDTLKEIQPDIIIVAAFGQRVNVIGDSMSPVLKNGNVVMINHFIYNIKDPSRGDIAAFQKDGDERYFVKRIVGLPGETVQIKEGKLLIDGKPLKAEYVSDIGYAGTASEPVHLGKDEYFLLGDNETASDDSREEKIGNIKKKEIYGEVWFVIKPWSDIGFVSD